MSRSVGRRFGSSVLALASMLAFLLVGGDLRSFAGSTPSAGPADAAHKKDESDGKSKKGKKAKEDAAKKDEKEEPKEPPFEKITKGTREIKGLFTVYAKDDDAKYFLRIDPSQLDVTFLINPTLVSGLGEGFLYPSDMWPEYPVQLHRVGKTIQLIHKNPYFKADGSSLHSMATLAAPDAIVSQAKIESQPDPATKGVLVDMAGLFLGDLEGMSLALKAVLDTPYAFDGGGSSFVAMKGYPDNLDFEMILNYKTQEAKNRPTYAADPRSMLIRFYYSISKLPGDGYRPRLADDRVGHFLTVMDDYADESVDTPAVRYVNRWRLEKKDPGAALSEPKQPIVFYLENTIPAEYRGAVKRGIEAWNSAFEAAGFKNAIQAKDQPEDPNWNAADVRYASIRWIVAPGAGFAQGPSRVNPYTGEIFDADIRFSADLVRGFHQEYQKLTQPTSQALARMSGPRAAMWQSLVGWLDVPELLATSDASGLQASAPARWMPPGTRPDRSFASMGYCDFARGFMDQMALGYDVLVARGEMTPEKEKEYVNQALVYITLHEVGHTLGLRHNFKSSSFRDYTTIQDMTETCKNGLTGSVMDYIPVNLAPRKAGRQGEYFQSSVGPYDKWAIQYAYMPIAADSPAAEKPELSRIASQVAQVGLAYGTDEDSFGGSPRGMDPLVNMWDLSHDSFAYYRNNADRYRELVSTMEARFAEPGTRYQRLRSVYGTAVNQMFPAAVNISKYVGGISHNRDHIGDPGGRVPYVPVPAAQQREALNYLTTEIFGPDAMKIPAHLLNKLAAERLPDLEGTMYMAPRNDFPIHNLVLAVQSIPMDRLYSTVSLARLNDMEARSGEKDLFTMAEMFSGVRKAVWSELQTRGNVNSFRRNLQRMHLEKLVTLAVSPPPGTPEDARTLARADLIEIRHRVDATLASENINAMTRAHLDETKARINAALAAGMERQIPKM